MNNEQYFELVQDAIVSISRLVSAEDDPEVRDLLNQTKTVLEWNLDNESNRIRFNIFLLSRITQEGR